MRQLITIIAVLSFILPVAVANHCSTGHTTAVEEATDSKNSEVTCPYMKAKAEGKTEAHEGKVCPVTGKKANSEKTTCPYMKAKADGKTDAYEGKVCPVSGKKAGMEKAVCPKDCTKSCCSGSHKAVVQTKCPVMGGEINKDYYVDHQGKRIYLCCAGCIGKVKADPGKYIEKIEKMGVKLAKVPVMK